MLGIFTSSPVFTKSTKFIRFENGDSIMMHHDIRPLTVTVS